MEPVSLISRPLISKLQIHSSFVVGRQNTYSMTSKFIFSLIQYLGVLHNSFWSFSKFLYFPPLGDNYRHPLLHEPFVSHGFLNELNSLPLMTLKGRQLSVTNNSAYLSINTPYITLEYCYLPAYSLYLASTPSE